jgi:hypothetical protein
MKGDINMHDLAGKGPIMQTMMTQTWELLTVEQKKKVSVMRMDKIIKILEMKISGMEEMIKLKKEAIADIQKVKEMMK